MSIAIGIAKIKIAEKEVEVARYNAAVSLLRDAMTSLVGAEAASLIPLSAKNGGGMQSPIYINLHPGISTAVMRCCVAFAKCYHNKGDYVKVR